MNLPPGLTNAVARQMESLGSSNDPRIRADLASDQDHMLRADVRIEPGAGAGPDTNDGVPMLPPCMSSEEVIAAQLGTDYKATKFQDLSLSKKTAVEQVVKPGGRQVALQLPESGQMKLIPKAQAAQTAPVAPPAQTVEVQVHVDDISYPIRVSGVYVDSDGPTVVLAFPAGSKLPKFPDSRLAGKTIGLEFEGHLEPVTVAYLGLKFEVGGSVCLIFIRADVETAG